VNKQKQHKSLPARAVGWAAKQLGYQLMPTQTPQQQNSSLNRLFRWVGLTYSWGDWTAKNYVDRGYMGNADLYSIINRITRTAACAPFRVYKVKDERKHQLYKAWTGERSTPESLAKAMLIKAQVYEEDTTHPLNALLAKPNGYQTANEFTQASIGFKLITGNRFWFKNVLEAGANAGKPFAVYNLPPQHMTIIAGGQMFEVLGYTMNCGNYVEIPKQYVIHSRYWNPNYDMAGSHLWGLAPLKAGSKTVDLLDKAEQRSVIMMDNAGAAGLVFNKAAQAEDMSTEQAGELKRKLNEEVLGMDNAGAIALANGDLGWINFAQKAVDMELIAQKKMGRDTLCNIYGAPPGLFDSNANATDNNIKAWNKQLITNCCLPALSEMREDWNEIAKLYDDKIYVDYDISVFPELQEDLEKVAKVMDRWCFTGNELRLALGYGEDTVEPMMKRYFARGAMQELSNLDPDKLEEEIDNAERAANTGRNSGDQDTDA
jgi:HK97 family phage portal protein